MHTADSSMELMKIVRFSNLRESGVTTKVAASRATVMTVISVDIPAESPMTQLK